MHGFASGFAEIKHLDTHATLRVALFGAVAEPSAILIASYRKADPLAVNIEIRTVEEVTIFRRVFLRADLRAGMSAPVELGETRIAPSDGQMVEIRFPESGANVAVRVPVTALARFLRVTESLVPVDREGDVLGELAAALAAGHG